MSLNKNSNIKRLLLTVALFGITPSYVYAGFEWTPPAEESNAQTPSNEMLLPKGSALPAPVPSPVVQEEILAIPPSKNLNTPIQKPVKTMNTQKPVMKTQRIKNDPAPKATAQNEKRITRQKITPAPIPPAQQAIPATQQPIPMPQQEMVEVNKAARAPVIETQTPPSQPVSSVPRRKKPSSNQGLKLTSAKTTDIKANDVEQRTGAKVKAKAKAPELDKQKENVNSPMPVNIASQEAPQERPSGLKINPYPKKMKAPPLTPVAEQKTEGDRALESVYSGQAESSNNYAVVEGFGTDIPLAMALSQIVPPTYAYSFGDGVNPGRKVSWSGSKPWNEVLRETLAPLNLEYQIQGNKILLEKIDASRQAQESMLKKKLK